MALLQGPEGRRVSEPERLRRPPTRTTGTSMAKALERWLVSRPRVARASRTVQAVYRLWSGSWT
ncbi:hypothetical protein GCM10025734_71420 [Kitasatospora paranensis]